MFPADAPVRSMVLSLNALLIDGLLAGTKHPSSLL